MRFSRKGNCVLVSTAAIFYQVSSA